MTRWQESGVNRAPIYRRWPKRADLIRKRLSEHNSTLAIPELTHWPDTAATVVRRLDIDANTMMLMLLSPLLVLTLFQREPIDKKTVNNLIKIVQLMRFSV